MEIYIVFILLYLPVINVFVKFFALNNPTEKAKSMYFKINVEY